MSNIEAKLKQLKVVDLKDILQKASVALPAKANKADLIAKIIATPAAVELFNKQHSPNGTSIDKPSAPPLHVDNDLLAPPEQFDWESTVVTVPLNNDAPAPTNPTTTTTTKPVEKPVPVKPSAPAATTPVTTAASSNQSKDSKSPVNDDMEKRKKRAERFGIPLVESKQKPTTVSKASQNAPPKAAEDTSKLQARAARFGSASTNSSQKRSRSPAPADKEEEEKRRKRAERFGTTTTKA